MDTKPYRWFVEDKNGGISGDPTLYATEARARIQAEEYDVLYKVLAPHRVVALYRAPVAAAPRDVSSLALAYVVSQARREHDSGNGKWNANYEQERKAANALIDAIDGVVP
jgi:hypothetical protein